MSGGPFTAMCFWAWKFSTSLRRRTGRGWRICWKPTAWLPSGMPVPQNFPGACGSGAALIRTLALDPALLLLDEPFSALDYQTRLHVADDIGQIIRRERKTALLVTHDISEAISMADRVIILSPRPARVRRIVPVSLSIPERTPMRSREAPEFKTYFNLIWKELNSHEGD